MLAARIYKNLMKCNNVIVNPNHITTYVFVLTDFEPGEESGKKPCIKITCTMILVIYVLFSYATFTRTDVINP